MSVDLNRDGKLDLVLGMAPAPCFHLPGHGMVPSAAADLTGCDDRSPPTDVNRDGKPDLALRGQ